MAEQMYFLKESYKKSLEIMGYHVNMHGDFMKVYLFTKSGFSAAVIVADEELLSDLYLENIVRKLNGMVKSNL